MLLNSIVAPSYKLKNILQTSSHLFTIELGDKTDLKWDAVIDASNNEIKKSTINCFSQSISGIGSLVHLEWHHDHSSFIATFGCLHDPCGQRTPQFVRV